MTTTVEPRVIGLKQAFSTTGLIVAALAVILLLVVALDRLEVVRFSLLSLTAVIGGGAGIAALAVIWWWLLARHGWSPSALGFRRWSPRMAHLLWQVPLIVLAGAIVQGVFTVLVLGAPGPRTSEMSTDLDDIVRSGSLWPIALILVVGSVSPSPEDRRRCRLSAGEAASGGPQHALRGAAPQR